MKSPWLDPQKYISDVQESENQHNQYLEYAKNHPGAIDWSTAGKDPRGVMSNIVRGQWNEFSGNTIPLIKHLEQMTTYGGNKGVVEGLQTDARNAAKTQFGSIIPDAKREAQSYGMSLSKANIGTLGRAATLGLAQATVDGDNRATQFQQDLNRQIAAGSNLSSLKQND